MLYRCLTALLVVCLAACSSGYRAPVDVRGDVSRPTVTKAPSRYVVKRGDTLYSIAWRYGLDYRRIAALNSIGKPYAIYPGQRLKLKGRLPRVATRTASTRPKSSSGNKTSTAQSVGKKTTSAVAKKPSRRTSKPASNASTAVATGGIAWRWPSSGSVIRKFSSTVHKGIDLGGRRNDPVKASAAGKVVYAGSGIVGLGKLIIVKHNERYLSAYGNNEALLVKEGDSVKVGQMIARKGNSGTDTVKLHFEIRRDGRPVDPLRLLPRR